MGLVDPNGGAALPHRGERRILPLLLLPFVVAFRLAGATLAFAVSLIATGAIAHTIVWLFGIGWGLVG